MTQAISTALGSAPIPCAIERQIGTISAVVAVLDIKFVITQHRIKTTKVSAYGEGSLPSAPITVLAISSPAPVCSSAEARERVPPKRKIVFRSMDFRASFSEITPVRISSRAPIPPEPSGRKTHFRFSGRIPKAPESSIPSPHQYLPGNPCSSIQNNPFHFPYPL